MWISKHDWVALVSLSNERKVRVEMLEGNIQGLEERLSGVKNTLRKYNTAYLAEKQKTDIQTALIEKLETKLLELNDEVVMLKKQSPPPFDFNAMFTDEDPEQVEKMRQRIRDQGADMILVESMET